MKPHPDLFKGVPAGKPEGPFLKTWGRRVGLYLIYSFAWLAITITSPILLPIAAIIDLVKRHDWIAVRFTLFFWVYFGFELIAVVVMGAQWLFSGIWLGINQRRLLMWNFATQRWWVLNLVPTMLRLFKAKMVVEGDHDLRKRKFLLFMRHSSMADTVFGPFFAYSQMIHLRIVVKRELLMDPAIELSFNRMPNVFVRRGGVDSRAQIEAVGRMMDTFAPGEGVLMYPEGTRYTEEKKRRILEKLEKAGPAEAHARAKALRRSLPPRPGGPLKLLERNTDADVIFLAHTGLEETTHFRAMWNGGFIGKTLRFKFWRVPFEQIPKTNAEREEWLYENWLRVDEFVVQHLGAPEESDAPEAPQRAAARG